MATTKITSPDLFNLESLNTALKLPSGTTAERPTSPSTGEWRYNTTTNLIEFWDGGEWRDLQSEDIPPIPSENFNVVLYTGTGSAQSITGVGFKPDLVWIKERSGSAWHSWFDTTRGVGNRLSSNSVNAQNFDIQRLSSFDADGFSLGTDGDVNGSGKTFVAWCWKVGGGTTSSNTEGSITSDVQANTKAGFSLVKFTGTGANGTVGHGLGVAPEIIIFKNYPAISGWKMFTNQTPSPATQVMELQDTSGFQTPTNPFNSTLPTSSVFSLGTYGDVNASGGTFIAYCFASVAGYSKVGSYTGNGSITGPLVNTGFEPAMIILKEYDGTDNWAIVDNKRSTTNPRQNWLRPNLSNAEFNNGVDSIVFLSNGFQIGGGSSASGFLNENGKNYLYIAFASDASAAPALPDSFANKLYTGTSATNSITGLGFSPSLSWFKSRSNATSNVLHDTVRGGLSRIFSNSTAAASTTADGFVSFDSDGFTLDGTGSGGDVNGSGRTYVSWNWKANPMPSILTDGTIQSIASANQAAGFSIVKYVGNGVQGATVAHGLGSAPDLIILKDLSSTESWLVGNSESGWTKAMHLDLSNADNASDLYWDDTAPTSSVFSLGATGSSYNVNGNQYIAYCWHSLTGFSKIGSYTGDGTTTKTITTGFQPNFVLIKVTDGADNWVILDSARGGSKNLKPNSSAAEATEPGTNVEFLSTGFKLIGSGPGLGQVNGNGNDYIYMAFKENPSPPTPIVIPAGQMSYMVVAGGASGASNGGGGGAGGLRTSYGSLSGGGASSESNITLSNGTYTITIGAGGALVNNSTSYQDPGNDGTATTISGNATVNTVGGGGGGSNNFNLGRNGGCGGGAGAHPGAAYNGGSGTAGEGFDGGRAGAVNQPYAGAGGGGTGAVGEPNSASAAGAGGDGLQMTITGARVNYGGGGGGTGGTATGSLPGGAGGAGGGGTGGAYNGNGVSGTANTGGGGGGSGDGGSLTSGAGGSGVVILRMNTSDYSGTTTGSPTVTTDNSYTILTYTGSGTYVHS